jgi:peroxiredoxin
MMTRTQSSVVVAVLLLAGTAAHAGKFNKAVDVGDKPAAWSGLTGADGEQHSLADYAEAKVLVVAFTGDNCPVAADYVGRFKKFAADHQGGEVAFVAVNCDVGGPDKLARMKERAARLGFNFDYLHDPTQEVPRSYGALCTPHLFVLDARRRIAYMGAFDNSRDPSRVKHDYVRDAVAALLRGERPEVTETLQFGCGIEYKDRQ